MKTPVSLLLIALASFSLTFCKKDKAITPPDEPVTPTTNTQTGDTVAISVVAQNLELPWGLAYLPDGSLLFTERKGKINLLKAGQAMPKTIMQRQVNTSSEGGLLSIAVDPMFTSNHYVYIYETVGTSHNRVVQFTLNDETLTLAQIIVDNIPYGVNHDGGALKFGPDGYLYIGTGDVMQSSLAQDKNTMAGKILRVDRGGAAVSGNPFNDRIWSYGHRNVQGFTWMPGGQMLATEHGPSGENGWCCHDEINLIQAGKNYGWPLAYSGNETDPLTPALIHSGNDTWAPSGCVYTSSKAVWPNRLVVASLRGQRLIRFNLNADGKAISSQSDTLNGVFNRIRNIIEAPDGSLIFCTSNIGSINSPIAGDDKIYRVYKK